MGYPLARFFVFTAILSTAAPETLANNSPIQALELKSEARLPHSSLASDQRNPVILERLPNGLRFAILKRQSHEAGVAIFMRVKGGFLAEQRPGERGLAHLIEHLVFHSPTRNAPNDLHRFGKIGMPLTLPEPAGGTTSWRESDYFVVSRTTNPADLTALLGLFGEVSRDLIFRADIVDGQRLEVSREMADKKNGNEIFAAYIAAVAPGSPADVINGQNSDDVPSASIETIDRLYKRLYRPENVMIVVVGDVDPILIKNTVKEHFASWQSAPPLPDHVIPQFNPQRIAAISHSALRDGRNTALLTSVAVSKKSPIAREVQVRDMLMDSLITQAINNKMAMSRPDDGSEQFGFYIEQGEMGHRLLMFWDDFAPTAWRPAVASLQGMACDLNVTGFSEAELDQAKTQIIAELRKRANEVAFVPNFQLSKELADSVTLERYLIAPDELISAAIASFPQITAKSTNKWWKTQWKAGTSHLRVESTQFSEMKNVNDEIREVTEKANNLPICKIQLR